MKIDISGRSTRIAFGGLASALSVVLLLANNLLPTATLALTAASAVIVFLISVEFKTPLAIAVYIVSAVLSAFLVPANPNVFWLYTVIFGLFSVIKRPMDMIQNSIVKYACKVLFSAVAYAAYVCVLFFVIGLTEFITQWLWAVILGVVAFIAVFLIYDNCLTKIAVMYRNTFRNKVFK